MANPNSPILINCANYHLRQIKIYRLLNQFYSQRGIVYVKPQETHLPQLTAQLFSHRPQWMSYHQHLPTKMLKESQDNWQAGKTPILCGSDFIPTELAKLATFIIITYLPTNLAEFTQLTKNSHLIPTILLLCHSDYYRLFSPSKTQFNLPATYKYLQTLKCMLHHSQASCQNLPNYQLEQQAYRYRFQLLQQCRQTIAHQNQLQAESLLADISLAYASTLDWRYPVSWQNLPAVGQGAYPYMQACFHLALSSKPNSVFWQSI